MPHGGIELRVPHADQERINELAKAMRAEFRGAQLRKDLIADLRLAVAPGVSAVKEKLRAWPHDGVSVADPALTPYLANRVRTQVRLTGEKTGIRIRIPKTPSIRGFNRAASSLNSARGWRHPVFGKDRWVQQISPLPGYFDDTLNEGKPLYRAAVLRALAKMERRILARVRV